LLLHVTAAAYHGVPVYFQVIAPWDKPWRSARSGLAGFSADVSSAVWASVMLGCLVVGGFFARRNILRGRGDARGALRLVAFAAVLNCTYGLSNYHYVPRPDYISVQFAMLGIPLFFALLAWIGYMAVEPYARRTWPKLMVSWQRLLNGGLRDPLVGRDVLAGALAGSAMIFVFGGLNGVIGITEAFPVPQFFGEGVLPTVGFAAWQPSQACTTALIYLGLLTIATGILRRRWLALGVTSLVFCASLSPSSLTDLGLAVLFVIVFLTVLTRLGLVAAASFFVIVFAGFSPPLTLGQWYAGRAMIALLFPLALLLWSFYVSLGGQPIFGSALEEE